MNNPTVVNDSARPAASATGPSRCRDAEAPSTIGRIGNTQGDRIERTPATKASAMPPIAM
jgi:hypothetical protein